VISMARGRPTAPLPADHLHQRPAVARLRGARNPTVRASRHSEAVQGMEGRQIRRLRTQRSTPHAAIKILKVTVIR
jgi:hypothetical protein